MKQHQNIITPLLFIAFMYLSVRLSPQEQKQVRVSEIIFQQLVSGFEYMHNMTLAAIFTGLLKVSGSTSASFVKVIVSFHFSITKLLDMLFQISFQEFKNKLLEPGLVDRIVVSNKSVAKVFVRSTSQNANQTSDDVVKGPANGIPARRNTGQYKYYFNIGSVESFEEKLEEAQEALGIDPHDYIPVTYASEVNWFQELMRFAPTALLLGTLWFMGRRVQNGFGVGGPGGRGGRGIFNIGKANITKMDKNAKDKVCHILCCGIYSVSIVSQLISSMLI